MHWIKYLGVLSATVLWFSFSLAFAGGIDRFFFNSSALRMDPSKSDISAADVTYVEARVKQSCADGSVNICVHWNLVLDSAVHETTYASKLQAALQVWSGNADVPVRMNYVGTLPSNPVLLGQDPFQNSAMSGNFIVSFAPPSTMVFSNNEVSQTQTYIVPNLTQKSGEIKGAGIYFNPRYIPDRDFDLKSALLHELGRSLGLSPSGVTHSIMYPIRISSSPRTALSNDDILWAGALYGSSSLAQKSGQISGEVLNGKDGSPWIGGHIQALPTGNAEIFMQSLDRGLFTSGTFSKDNGKFSFRALPVGDYILLVEPDSAMPAPLSLLDAWLQTFSTTGTFENEFYDGADRESNQEPVYSFSPQALYYAATLVVTAEKENSGVTLVTNVADPNIKRIAAKGASAEVLSTYKAPEQKQASDTSASQDDSSGGCKMRTTDREGWMFNLMGGFFALFLLLQVRRGLKARSYHSECQKPSRSFR